MKIGDDDYQYATIYLDGKRVEGVVEARVGNGTIIVPLTDEAKWKSLGYQVERFNANVPPMYLEASYIRGEVKVVIEKPQD